MAEQPHADTDNTIQVLRDALTNKVVLHEPWTFGIIPLSHEDSTLVYKLQEGLYGAINLFSITPTQAEELNNACKPATFGLNQKDVLDLTYRRARKLDRGEFFWTFNPDSGESMEEIVAGLFPWGSLDKGIRFEVYKLNVYGEGSFFKAHQDTPRSQDMFGSLVVVLPFSHEGGNLLLRHRGREYAFNGSVLLQETPVPSAAYIAFFSDVEHEVVPVESGHRVTITYNLYFDSTKGAPILQTPISTQFEHPFKTALRACLEGETTRQAHPFLGFGLEHTYPFECAILQPHKLQLKGSDITLIQILTSLGIDFDFFLLYFEPLPSGDPTQDQNQKGPFRVLSKTIVTGNENMYEERDGLSMIGEYRQGSFLVWDTNPKPLVGNVYSNWYSYQDGTGEFYRSLEVEWVREPNEEQVDRSAGFVYGNEPSLEHFYHHLCVVAAIARPEEAPHWYRRNLGDRMEEDYSGW